ncbi:MAG: hypothetical protein WD801_11655 [Gemmatimonadaceae bacterium]
MVGPRFFGLSALLMVVTAGVPDVSSAQGPLKPRAGPGASLYVNYSGGMVNRRLSATFSVDRDAYVLVGHLGGDGTIRVVYPDRPNSRDRVQRGTRIRTDALEAHYDGIPSLFSAAVSPFRHSGALMDSYDGRGHGYLFIIASDRRLDYDRMSDRGEWQELSVDNFANTSDPRWAVRDFADLLAGSDGGYTLRFASSSQSQYMTSHAARAWDCSMMLSMGYSPYAWSYFHGGFSTWDRYYSSSSVYGRGSYCGEQSWMGYDRMNRYRSRPIIVIAENPVVPATPTTPTVTRGGRRPLGETPVLSLDRGAMTPAAEPAPRATLAAVPRRALDRRRPIPASEVVTPRPTSTRADRGRTTEPRAIEERSTTAGRETEEQPRTERPTRTQPTERPVSRPTAQRATPAAQPPSRPASKPRPDSR